ncbi:MAG: alpha-galactosidase [Adhaeribacter sp.]
MNKIFTPTFLTAFLLLLSASLKAQSTQSIVIETKDLHLVYTVQKNKLYQSYFGKKLSSGQEYGKAKASTHEAYIPSGTYNLFEPAIKLTHADHNPSLDLDFQDVETQKLDDNLTQTRIHLKDPKYPVDVYVCFSAASKENVIRTWTEISHQEKKPVTLHNFASAMLHFDASEYWLTQFHGINKGEMKMQESKLTSGIKTIDSKLGSRAHMYQTPVFFVSLDKPSDENSGELIAGTLAWSGNFQFSFELDEKNSLRVLAGMNPFSSTYQLEPKKKFITPEFIFTYSDQGKGPASRNFHDWGRKYGVLDGDKPRFTLLNNWEATFFDFNQPKLDTLIHDAARLGVDMFLLDDGWFGNKYPRDNDKAGLGDWQEDRKKLPEGIGHLVKQSTKEGVKFGIWLEPEMVNPKSELYEKHPDWILKLPNRDEHYYRSQLVLDLSNPKVQNFIYELVDDLLRREPGIAYIKWDCNRMMTNAYSPYLKDKQSHLYIEYVQGLYKVLDRIRGKYPHFPMMLCSGGGGRVDYGALKYFTEFWPSDNTKGYERVFIQWGYSHFYPALAMCAHITTMGQESLKFRTDVAMMGKLGYDIQFTGMSEKEWAFSKNAVQTYKGFSDVIYYGDLYRLISPYKEDRAVLMYVNDKKDKAVLFSYTLHVRDRHYYLAKTRLQGLDPNKQYTVKEVNLFPGTKSSFYDHGKTYSGDYLMKVGIGVSSTNQLTSSIFEIAEKK